MHSGSFRIDETREQQDLSWSSQFARKVHFRTSSGTSGADLMGQNLILAIASS